MITPPPGDDRTTRDHAGFPPSNGRGASDEGGRRPAGAEGALESAPLVRRLPMTHPAAEPLLRGLTGEYETRYGGGTTEMAAYDLADFEPPAGCFLVLTVADRTVAGGGFRRLDSSTAEIKRMWTDPAYRRRGLARRVLDLLEAEAAARGYRRLRLETGLAQPEAVALYEAMGWVRGEGYGRHRDSPRAVFFEKRPPAPPR
jgi:GNAT superfamily N-acetyltransferase